MHTYKPNSSDEYMKQFQVERKHGIYRLRSSGCECIALPYPYSLIVGIILVRKSVREVKNIHY